MAYKIYQTEGVILSKKDFGEADRFFSVYTEEFGLINAVAQGVRYSKSKLRYSLDLFSYSRFSIIMVKDFWRIIDAEEAKSMQEIFSEFGKMNLFSKIAIFLMRMIKGEERSDFIWQELKNLLLFLEEKKLSKDELRDLEILTVARILHDLGYMEIVPVGRKMLVPAINKAIQESML